MSETVVSDRRATWSEVAARRVELRNRALACGLTDPRLRGDGAVIVRAPDPGYRLTGRFAHRGSRRGRDLRSCAHRRCSCSRDRRPTSVTSAELLAGLVRTLDQLTELTELGRERYDTDVLVRLAVQRLWITAGNYAEAYRSAAGVEAEGQPWSELYGNRSVLARMLPEEISDDRVWFETLEGAQRLRDELPDSP